VNYSSIQKLVIGTLAMALVAGFQNCSSQVDFSRNDQASSNLEKNNGLEIDTNGDNDSDNDSNGDMDIDTDTDDTTHSSNPHGHVSGTSCKDIEIFDIRLNVDGISSNAGDIADGPGAVNMSKLESGFEFKSTVDVSASQLRLVLNESGNYILGADEKNYNLKTPSQQQSGLKILLGESFALKAGKTYILKVNFEPSTQIVSAGSKCILKPVLRVESITLKP
jgi:hypothetical protein